MCFVLKLFNSCKNSTEKSPRKSSNPNNGSKASVANNSKHSITSLNSNSCLTKHDNPNNQETSRHNKIPIDCLDTTLILETKKKTYPNTRTNGKLFLAEFDSDEYEFDNSSIKDKLLHKSKLDLIQSRLASKSNSLTNSIASHRRFSNVQRQQEQSPLHQINLKYRTITDYCNECNYYSCECDRVTTNSTVYNNKDNNNNSRNSPVSFGRFSEANELRRLNKQSTSVYEEEFHSSTIPQDSLKNTSVSRASSRNSLNSSQRTLTETQPLRERRLSLDQTISGSSSPQQQKKRDQTAERLNLLSNGFSTNQHIPFDLNDSTLNTSSQSSQPYIDMNNSINSQNNQVTSSLASSFSVMAQITDLNRKSNGSLTPELLDTPPHIASVYHENINNNNSNNNNVKMLPNKFPAMGMTMRTLNNVRTPNNKNGSGSGAPLQQTLIFTNNSKKKAFIFNTVTGHNELLSQDDADLSQELEKQKKDLTRPKAKGGKITIAPSQVYDFKESDLKELGQIGNGEFGTVHKALHTPSQTLMAVKRIGPTVGNQVERKKVLKELDFVLECNENEFVVKFYGVKFNNEPADCLICMELMDTSLEKFYKFVYGVKKEEIPESILGKVAVATVSGLDYLREKHSIIHRDVKPSNMLINKHGEIKMCDFGISGKLVDSIAASRDAGCQLYMAPERIDPSRAGPCHAYDVRSDIWSLGISMYELATGKFPYPSWTNIFKQLSLVVNGDAPQLKPGRLSKQFCSFVNTCLTKDETKRPKYRQLKEHPLYKDHSHSIVNVSEYVSPYITEMLSDK